MVSVVDYMTKAGQDPSFENRKMLFNQFFPGQEFSGTAEQNQLLMGKMQDPNNPAKPGPNVDPNNPNAGNAGKEVVRDAGSGQNVEGQWSKGLILDPETGLPTSLGVTKDVDNPDGTQKGTQEFSVQQLNEQNITVDPNSETGTGMTSDLSKTGYGGAITGGATGANSNTSNAVDFKAQKDVDESKEELDKVKPPQTLFGMASKSLDKSGFTQGAKDFGNEAGGWGMEGLGKMGMDEGIMGNLGGAAQAGAGGMGKMLGMAGSALSPLMAGMGTAMHGMGSAMMGMQMPRY